MLKNKILSIWNELTDFTYIYGMEDEVFSIMQKYINKKLSRDEYGNYYVTIGNSETLFVSHLDVVAKQKLKVTKIKYKKDNHRFVKTDGFTVLGADDKTGVVIMLNMISNNIPGTYYFLIGEEVGTIGSGLLYKEKGEYLSSFKRCVAFDRKGYGSIINRQMGEYCCSHEFVNSLASEFNKTGMDFKADSTGVWTDSAVFMGFIPECTNISVGYFNEHTYKEEQDIDYMLKLAETVINIDWENLPTVRTPKTFDTEDPIENNEKGNKLPLYKLTNLFNEIDDLIYDNIGLFSSNINFFKPGKEMKYFRIRDLKDENKFSLWLNWDGSIKIYKNGENLFYKNIDELKEDIKFGESGELYNLVFSVVERKILNFKDFKKI